MRKLFTVAMATAAMVAINTTPASAATPYDPNVARVANPANVCKSIPGSVQRAAEIFGMPIDTSSFNYRECVTLLAKGDVFIEPAEEFGSPYAQCDQLEKFGVISYPDVLHEGADMEDMLLPDFIIKNRKECGSALYAYHSIVSFFGPPPGLFRA